MERGFLHIEKPSRTRIPGDFLGIHYKNNECIKCSNKAFFYKRQNKLLKLKDLKYDKF